MFYLCQKTQYGHCVVCCFCLLTVIVVHKYYGLFCFNSNIGFEVHMIYTKKNLAIPCNVILVNDYMLSSHSQAFV